MLLQPTNTECFLLLNNSLDNALYSGNHVHPAVWLHGYGLLSEG